jgi:hypothetical protein
MVCPFAGCSTLSVLLRTQLMWTSNRLSGESMHMHSLVSACGGNELVASSHYRPML